MVTQTQVKTLHEQQTSHVENKTQTNLDSRIQDWDTASTSSVANPEHFQSKALRMTVGTPWYVLNTVIQRNLQTPTIKEEICHYSSKYRAHLSTCPKEIICLPHS
jgi:hypothetical protein